MVIIPKPLRPGNTISIIAPSGSMNVVNNKILDNIEKYFGKLGISVAYGKYNKEDYFGNGGTIEQRIFDIMEAFRNPKIHAIIPIFGGFTANQLLPHLNYEIIKNNPKIFMGYSDITALNIAIFSKTGLMTYLGPGGTQLGHYFPDSYTIGSFEDIIINGNKKNSYMPSKEWREGAWRGDDEKDKREKMYNKGWNVVSKGKSEGIAFGGNLSTITLLIGTEYFNIPEGSILFLEECGDLTEGWIVRMLEQLYQTGVFSKINGLVLGRFEKMSKVRQEYIIENIKRYVRNIPIVLDADLGHTEPMMTIPIGSKTILDTDNQTLSFLI